MADARSSVDISRLIQHIALNKSGWWTEAMERLVLACLYRLGPSTETEIRAAVVDSCGIDHKSRILTLAIDSLVQRGSINQLGTSLRLSEATQFELRSLESETLDSEERARTRFVELAISRGLNSRSDILWHTFETEVVLPTVERMGAQLYEYLTTLTSSPAEVSDFPIYERVVDYDDNVRSLFVEFLDPRDNEVRQFVLRRLNAQYAIDAAALPEDSLDRLTALGSRHDRIDIFLDTNVLFSVLGLHVNPGDEVATDLLRLVDDLKDRLNLRLYVIPETVEEARRTIRSVMSRLADFSPQRNLAEAATRTRSLGLAGAYFEQAKSAGQFMTAEDYFGPYESDLVSILRGKSIELYNRDLSQLHTAQYVIDDMYELEDRQMFRPIGPKPYEANMHDMVLWHFVNSSRSPNSESPLDEKAWIVTLDYGMLRFDKRKRQESGRSAICLDPSSLVQFFQFWMPSTTQLDEALVGSVRQPLLFLKYDRQSEQVTLRILRQLSRYTDAEDLEADTVTAILTNEALRDRLATSGLDPANDEEFVSDEAPDSEIVHEGMLAVLQELAKKLEAAHHEHSTARNEIAELRNHIESEDLAGKLSRETTARSDAEDQLSVAVHERRRIESEKGDLSRQVEALESRVRAVEEDRSGAEMIRARRRENWRIGLLSLVSISVAGIAVGVGGILLDQWLRTALAWSGSAVAGVILVTVGLEITIRRTRFNESLITSHMRWVRGTVGTLVLAVGISIIGDWLRNG